MEKEYEITFTADYLQYKKWADEGDNYWRTKITGNPEQLSLAEKYSGKTIKLSDIPEFIKEVGYCILKDNEIEVYNDYRE